MSKRALRRHHYERLKKKRAEYYGGVFRDNPRRGIYVNSMPVCSCWMCGNWRKLGMLPTQERRHEAGCSVDEDLIYHRGV